MNQQEAVALCRTIKAVCPNQPIDAYTPDAWALILDDIPFAAAQAAVKDIYRNQGDDRQWTRTIEADDIIRHYKRTRTDRINHGLAQLVPPTHTEDNERAYREWLREACRRLGDGETPAAINADHTRGELKPRNLPIEGDAA